MSEKLKTIKELADEWGITKQTIQYHIRFCCKVFQKIYFSVKLRKKTERTE
uniref:helix-turn-helix domain-containing protein n=1 Tax=Lactococcus sp. TaxID=44273 RepID=UPI00324260DB